MNAPHRVAPSALGFVVLSGRSGRRYVVAPAVNPYGATCTCEAYYRRPGACSHIVAVREYGAQFVTDPSAVAGKTA